MGSVSLSPQSSPPPLLWMWLTAPQGQGTGQQCLAHAPLRRPPPFLQGHVLLSPVGFAFRAPVGDLPVVL